MYPKNFIKFFTDQLYIPLTAFRMGRMVGKLAMVLLLSKFNFETREKRDLEYSSSSVGLTPKDGIKIKVTKDKN